jgi:preprotein translocase subunit YajC
MDLLFIVVLVLLMGGYWSLVVFPKQRDFQKRQKMARTLAEGDEIVTGGGLVGKVLQIESDKGIAHVEIAEGVVVRLLIAAMVQRYDPEEIARNAQMGMQAQAEDAAEPVR